MTPPPPLRLCSTNLLRVSVGVLIEIRTLRCYVSGADEPMSSRQGLDFHGKEPVRDCLTHIFFFALFSLFSRLPPASIFGV